MIDLHTIFRSWVKYVLVETGDIYSTPSLISCAMSVSKMTIPSLIWKTLEIFFFSLKINLFDSDQLNDNKECVILQGPIEPAIN